MGQLFDRLLFLMRSGARDIKSNIEEDFIPNLRDRILKYTFELKGLSQDDFEKKFQEYLNKVRQFWQDSNTSHESHKQSFKDSNQKWREKAYQEFEKNYQEQSQEFPDQIQKYFKALEIKPIRDKDAIKSQWKKMMLKYHPDLFNNNPDKRKVAAELSARLTQAYQELILYLGDK